MAREEGERDVAYACRLGQALADRSAYRYDAEEQSRSLHLLPGLICGVQLRSCVPAPLIPSPALPPV